MYKKIFFSVLPKLKHGALKVIDEKGHETTFGEGEPYFTLVIKKTRFYRRIVAHSELGFGEAYMNGDIEIIGGLGQPMRLYLENKQELGLLGKISTYRYDQNVKETQKEEIHRHYDLGNDFFKLWFDESMTYTCAYFKNPKFTLEQAQQAKVDHLLKKLQLSKGQTLLDIGPGWGHLLFTAAQKYDIEGLGVTLSEEQLKYCKKRAKQLGLEKRVKFALMNYQDLDPAKYQFDRIISVGMFEAVGKNNLWTYMQSVHDLLPQEGISVLHTITKQNEYPIPRWLDKYIFPGGYIPSIRSIIQFFPEYNFRLLDIENLRLNYALTLDEWLKRFDANVTTIEKMYDEKFVKMWRLWLASSSASFRYGENDLMQIVFSKGINNDLPLTRDYLYK